VPALEGPPHDAAALQKLLVERWGFPAGNVKTLIDGQATRAAILSAIDALAAASHPGDYVFIYFSGHGTSSYDRRDLGLDNNTGALVPADVKRTDPNIIQTLIVGSRDLRPRLEKIDRDRKVLAIFDSCYSAAAVRSVRAMGRSRFLEMPPAPRSRPAASDAPPAPLAPYPYQNLVYISAASQSEAAIDITRSEIANGVFETVDGEPHGALTNFLIEGLGGIDDLDHDGTLTYGELYSFLRDKVTESFPHQPQMLAPEARTEAVLRTPVFDEPAPKPAAGRPPGGARPSAAAPLRVRLEGVSAALVRDIRKLADVRVVDGRSYDVLFAQDDSGFRLVHRSGDLLASFGPGEAQAAKERLQRQGAVRSLLDLTFPDQDFGATLSIPGRRGFLTRGDAFAIDVTADRDSVFLLLDVDASGHVSVLYPFNEAELAARRTLRVPSLPDELRVSPPFGTEYLRLFAFAKRPAGIERWLKASFPASDAKLRELVDWLRAAGGSRATDKLKVVTRESATS
jgi:hypothetical protein